VRFFPSVSAFIAEGELRHPRQIIKKHPDYLDYSLKLPPRSLDEFSFWVNRYFNHAVVLSPPELVDKYRQAALSLVQRYQ
jgi:predicted DNA-binding transcriptional regulator YafY